MPEETEGEVKASNAFFDSFPDPEPAYDLDPALEPNKFPRESGSDSFGDIARSIP